MNFEQAKQILVLAGLGGIDGANDTYVIDHAVDVIYSYINEHYGVHHGYRPFSATLDTAVHMASKALSDLATHEKAMPNLPKSGIAYELACRGKPWVSIPDAILSYLGSCGETEASDC